MIFYGVLGVNLFKGKNENRCRMSEFPLNEKWLINQEIPFLCGALYECPNE